LKNLKPLEIYELKNFASFKEKLAFGDFRSGP
jgi:hypothetical protein